MFIFTELSNILHGVRKRHSNTFAVIVCLVIVNREQEWGKKCRSWIISKGKKLHLNVLKGLIETMKLPRVFNWQAQKWNVLLLSLKNVESKGGWSCKLKIKVCVWEIIASFCHISSSKWLHWVKDRTEKFLV